MSSVVLSRRSQATMLRSLPAILSIVILILGPRACCLSTFITQATTKTSSTKSELAQKRCCCKNHCKQNEDTPSDDKQECPCEKWHGQNNAIVQSILKCLSGQVSQSFNIQHVISCHFQVVAYLAMLVGHEPVGFPRMCASNLLCLISIARC